MTGRERVIAAIERTSPDRIPRYDGFWEDTLRSISGDLPARHEGSG